MSEKEIESYFKKQVESIGGLCYKLTCPGVAGVPDRMCLLPDGKVAFVEVKAAGGKLSARQKRVIGDMAVRGHSVRVVRSLADVDILILKLAASVGGAAYGR